MISISSPGLGLYNNVSFSAETEIGFLSVLRLQYCCRNQCPWRNRWGIWVLAEYSRYIVLPLIYMNSINDFDLVRVKKITLVFRAGTIKNVLSIYTKRGNYLPLRPTFNSWQGNQYCQDMILLGSTISKSSTAFCRSYEITWFWKQYKLFCMHKKLDI